MNPKARQVVLGILSLMIVGVAVGLYVVRSGGDATPSEFNMHGICLACQEEVDVEVSLRNPPPLKCPKCGEVAVYRLLYCKNCQNTFAAEIIRRDGEGRLRPARIPSCPGCGSGEVSPFPLPDPNAYEVKGRLPLPPWPPNVP